MRTGRTDDCVGIAVRLHGPERSDQQRKTNLLAALILSNSEGAKKTTRRRIVAGKADESAGGDGDQTTRRLMRHRHRHLTHPVFAEIVPHKTLDEVQLGRESDANRGVDRLDTLRRGVHPSRVEVYEEIHRHSEPIRSL
jgi:hypothetical protein